MAVSPFPGPAVGIQDCCAAGRCVVPTPCLDQYFGFGQAVEDSPLTSSSRNAPLKLSM